jgi:NAD(P)-dependent dehydrogenase (short-subunit alcohol dehydrogenase family)
MTLSTEEHLMSTWSVADIPSQKGKVAVVTGATSGIGLAAATRLAAKGATVVLACRNVATGRGAAEQITIEAPGAVTDVVQLDLASLRSVRSAADQIRAGYGQLDLLVNNAGLMFPPLGRTEDGFELQFGTNHLGHFALTGLLLDRLLAAPGSRVVTVSSFAHRQGRIDWDDLDYERRPYRRQAAYGQSKLANLLFSYELQRRLAEAGASTIAVALSPGVVPTRLTRHSTGSMRLAVDVMTRLFGQRDADAGALATLRAATDPGARGGEYYGPNGFLGWSGRHPRVTRSSARSYDAAAQKRLWGESERLTGVSYDFIPR